MKRPAAQQPCRRSTIKRPASVKPLKRPASASGVEDRGGQRNETFVDYVSELTPEVLNREQFLAHLKKYIATTVPKQHVEIAVQCRDSHNEAQFIYRFYCKSCADCMSFVHGFRGRATYDCATKRFQVRATPLSAHGSFDRKQGTSGFGLRSEQKALALRAIREGGKQTVRSVLQSMASQSGRKKELPTVVALGHFMKNWKKRRVSKSPIKKKDAWTVSDLKNLCATLPKLEDVDANDHPLVLISSHVDEEEVALIMCNVPLFRPLAVVLNLCPSVIGIDCCEWPSIECI